jgi:hypothetical protein
VLVKLMEASSVNNAPAGWAEAVINGMPIAETTLNSPVRANLFDSKLEQL